VARVLGEAVSALRKAGVKVDERARPFDSVSQIYELYLRLLMPVMSAGYPDALFDVLVAAGANPNDKSPQAIQARNSTARFRDWARANEARAQVRARFAAFFRDFDVLLMPATPLPAIPHDHSEPLEARTMTVNGQVRPYFEALAWISPATLTWTASQAPVPARAGLPVSADRRSYLENRTTIDSRAASGGVRGFTPPPGF
jgi:amidase